LALVWKSEVIFVLRLLRFTSSMISKKCSC
jgi:hypothetical protein